MRKVEKVYASIDISKKRTPLGELDIPIYLDEEVKRFFLEKMKHTKEFSLNTVINSLLKQDIEISKKLA